jgi:hypothetical protein
LYSCSPGRKSVPLHRKRKEFREGVNCDGRNENAEGGGVKGFEKRSSGECRKF